MLTRNAYILSALRKFSVTIDHLHITFSLPRPRWRQTSKKYFLLKFSCRERGTDSPLMNSNNVGLFREVRRNMRPDLRETDFYVMKKVDHFSMSFYFPHHFLTKDSAWHDPTKFLMN